MKNDAEKKVSTFYNSVGWKKDNALSEDARRWEDTRECAKDYVSKCRLRVLRYIPNSGENILDMASGPIQYKEYIEFSKNFQKRYCIDLSSKALEDAKEKIGEHGEYICGSFFDIDLAENFFDCTVSLHTIYHIDKDKQEEAVRKLVAVTKPGKPVIIVYSNPQTFIEKIKYLIKGIKIIKNKLFVTNKEKVTEPELYFMAHPLKWWDRFRDVAELQLLPWRSFSSNHQKILVPNNVFGKILLDMLFIMEDRFPAFFVRYFQYPIIILVKKCS